MQWLMTCLSFYSKVVTHYQKPIVSLKAAVAEREGREPSPVPEDEPDDLPTMSRPRKSVPALTGSVDKYGMYERVRHVQNVYGMDTSHMQCRSHFIQS